MQLPPAIERRRAIEQPVEAAADGRDVPRESDDAAVRLSAASQLIAASSPAAVEAVLLLGGECDDLVTACGDDILARRADWLIASCSRSHVQVQLVDEGSGWIARRGASARAERTPAAERRLIMRLMVWPFDLEMSFS